MEINNVLEFNMTDPNSLINDCLKKIESKLNWGPGINWTTKDFHRLSEKIYEDTTVTLSVATLKRIWGKVSYNSKPTVTTLDVLAQFIGFENWRSFEHRSKQDGTPKITDTNIGSPSVTSPFYSSSVFKNTAAILLLIAILTMLYSRRDAPLPNPSAFQFSSEKMVTSGLPNSVIFNYDAQAANDNDTVIIQQSWDTRLRKIVSKDKKTHTSQYYYPGSFKAKLVVNNSIVKEHDLFIETNGWLPVVDYGDEIPVYFKPEDVIKGDGIMKLSSNQILEKNIPMHPRTPWTHFYYMNDLVDINLDDFNFSTQFKNTFNEGAAVCQTSILKLKFVDGIIYIPLSIKGCVSQLSISDINGAKPDPSHLGVDFTDWVNLDLKIKEGMGQLFINGELAYDLAYKTEFGSLRGITYEFQGTGMVNHVTFKNPEGSVIWEDHFN